MTDENNQVVPLPLERLINNLGEVSDATKMAENYQQIEDDLDLVINYLNSVRADINTSGKFINGIGNRMNSVETDIEVATEYINRTTEVIDKFAERFGEIENVLSSIVSRLEASELNWQFLNDQFKYKDGVFTLRSPDNGNKIQLKTTKGLIGYQKEDGTNISEYDLNTGRWSSFIPNENGEEDGTDIES